MDETLSRLVNKLTDARKQLEDQIRQAGERESLTAELLGRVDALKKRCDPREHDAPIDSDPDSSKH